MKYRSIVILLVILVVIIYILNFLPDRPMGIDKITLVIGVVGCLGPFATFLTLLEMQSQRKRAIHPKFVYRFATYKYHTSANGQIQITRYGNNALDNIGNISAFNVEVKLYVHQLQKYTKAINRNSSEISYKYLDRKILKKVLPNGNKVYEIHHSVQRNFFSHEKNLNEIIIGPFMQLEDILHDFFHVYSLDSTTDASLKLKQDMPYFIIRICYEDIDGNRFIESKLIQPYVKELTSRSSRITEVEFRYDIKKEILFIPIKDRYLYLFTPCYIRRYRRSISQLAKKDSRS